MKRSLIFAVMLSTIICIFGCSSKVGAGGPVFTKDLTLTISRTFVYVQNPLASTTQKTAYVLAQEDDLEVVAWRYVDSSWERVLPNYVVSDLSIMRSDSVMICPNGFVLPVEGQFDALTIKGTTLGGGCQVQVYK